MDILDDYVDKMRALQDSLLNAATDPALVPVLRESLRKCSTLAECMAMLMEDASTEANEVPY
jgi:hypothetical protein